MDIAPALRYEFDMTEINEMDTQAMAYVDYGALNNFVLMCDAIAPQSTSEIPMEGGLYTFDDEEDDLYADFEGPAVSAVVR